MSWNEFDYGTKCHERYFGVFRVYVTQNLYSRKLWNAYVQAGNGRVGAHLVDSHDNAIGAKYMAMEALRDKLRQALLEVEKALEVEDEG